MEWLSVVRRYSRGVLRKMNDQELEKQYLLNVPQNLIKRAYRLGGNKMHP
ncbi:BH0509 family protein [Bacillus sp. SL00103]